MIRITAPLKLISPNQKMHYMIHYKKDKKNRDILGFILNSQREKCPELPVHVRLIRHAKRMFDWSNYVSACKGIQDTIADFIIPGKAPGQADSSPHIYWHYTQEKLKKGEQESITVEIFSVQK